MPFSDFSPDATPFADPKLGISFETQDMMDDTLALLRFNCPEQTCDAVASGWNDLKRHVNEEHGLVLWYVVLRAL
jgi:E3 ubiquitin-protein ligase ZNF598